MKRRGRPLGILSALHARELSSSSIPFRTAAYSALVPASTFISVSGVPPVTFRRFTPCGRYLIAISRNHHDIVLYRFETGGRRSLPSSQEPIPDFESTAYNPNKQDTKDPVVAPLRNNWSPSSTPRFPDPTLSTPLTAPQNRATYAVSSVYAAGAGAGAGAGAATTTETQGIQAGSRPTVEGLLRMIPIPIRGETAHMPSTPRAEGASEAGAARRDATQKYSCHFSRFFSTMYELPVAPVAETLVADFCLATPKGRYLIVASYTAAEDAQAAEVPVGGGANAAEDLPAVSAVPLLEKLTLSLVDIEKGAVADRFVLTDDFVVLEGHGGVHMYGDMLSVLSIRKQTLHVIKVQENLGRFIEEGRIGFMCRSDDEMEIAKVREAEAEYRRRERELELEREQGREQDARLRSLFRGGGSGVCSGATNVSTPPFRTLAVGSPPLTTLEREGGVRMPPLLFNGDVLRDRNPQAHIDAPQAEAPPAETGLGNGKLKRGFYTGLMQRLLVYVYRKYHRENKQSMFYRVVGQYSLLVMLKAQFLDEDHLLIRLGSHERNMKSTDAATNTCFFVVYCISSATILNLYENRSTELLGIYEKYRDLFIGDAAVSATLAPPRSWMEGEADADGSSNFSHDTMDRGSREGDIDQDWSQRMTAMTAARDRWMKLKRTRVELAVLPFSCQTRNVSPYLDRSLFSYNADRISALDGTRALSLRELKTVKFISTESGTLRFKLSPGVPAPLAGGTRMDSEEFREGSLVQMQKKKKALFLFHPFCPFVISMEYSTITPTTYNFHVYGHL